MTEMKGKVAAVTGETRGLGLAIADQCAKHDASGLIVCGRSSERLIQRDDTRCSDLIK
jgi:NAD(P)-dependent dehydrogenase (short-subunit alcohol dehydrogenase family)